MVSKSASQEKVNVLFKNYLVILRDVCFGIFIIYSCCSIQMLPKIVDGFYDRYLLSK